MGCWLRASAIAGALLLSLASTTFEPDEYVCSSRLECPTDDNDYGQCVNGHCAFVDPACESGFRYDDTAGDDKNQCVPPEDFEIDAGAGDAAAADSLASPSSSPGTRSRSRGP